MKSILRSKTFWLNLIACIVALINNTGTILPPDLLASIVAATNVWVRLITKTPVSLTGQ